MMLRANFVLNVLYKDLLFFMFQSLILLLYQAALLFAYSLGGPSAAVIINTNVVIVKLFYNHLVGQSTSFINWILLIGFFIKRSGPYMIKNPLTAKTTFTF